MDSPSPAEPEMDAVWAFCEEHLLNGALHLHETTKPDYAGPVRLDEALAKFASLRTQSLGTHLSHCNYGEHVGTCKYGDSDCPALTEQWGWFGEMASKAQSLQEQLDSANEEIGNRNFEIQHEKGHTFKAESEAQGLRAQLEDERTVRAEIIALAKRAESAEASLKALLKRVDGYIKRYELISAESIHREEILEELRQLAKEKK